MTCPARDREPVCFGREISRQTSLVDQREWLVTNGLGGYASASVSGALTRSYHGLLVAALAPPGERTLLLSHLDETVEQDGLKRLELSSNLWQGGGAAPDAARSISRFELVAGHPRWLFADGELLFERRVWMEQGANTTFVRYRLLAAEAPVGLRIRALVNQRSFHGGDLPGDLRVTPLPQGVRVQRTDGDPAALELMALPESGAAAASLICQATAIPYQGHRLPREQERGLRSTDQHLQALDLSVTLAPGEAFTLRAHAASPMEQPGDQLHDDQLHGDPLHNDASIRPNQILAVSLPDCGLSAIQQQGVVKVCGRELLTDHGLRSLSPTDPAYAGHYGGGPSERDSRYHQGTVWGWLLGPYALAHHRCHGDRERALALLEPISHHLLDAGLGSVSEIFDGDAPHAPDGCIAQAWSVAEVLRCWQLIAAAQIKSG